MNYQYLNTRIVHTMENKLKFRCVSKQPVIVGWYGDFALNISFSKNGYPPQRWQGEDIVLETGDYLVLGGYNEGQLTSLTSHFYIHGESGARATASGNIMSLLDAENFPNITAVTAKQFYSCFSMCTSLTTAPQLPATTLASDCYNAMFSGCTSLTTAPQLPATTLPSQCYREMFRGCTSLTTAPQLPATTGPSQCYREMFSGCTSLTSLTVFIFDFSNKTYNWLSGTPASGSVIHCPQALADATTTRSASTIPEGWTIETF